VSVPLLFQLPSAPTASKRWCKVTDISINFFFKTSKTPRQLRILKVLTEARSSAVQILPQIQPRVHRLTLFFRTPIWILSTISGGQRSYTSSEIHDFMMNPKTLMTLRKKNETVINSVFSKSEGCCEVCSRNAQKCDRSLSAKFDATGRA
jgi:hypothetical protein